MSDPSRPNPPRTRVPRRRRPSSSRPRPPSAMPRGQASTHTIYLEIASLQMTRARQIKIRDALLAQVEGCDEEIALTERRTRELLAQIEQIEGRAQPAAPAPAAPRRRDEAPTVEELRSGAFTFKY